MVKAKSSDGASAPEGSNPSTAAMQRALDLFVSKAGGLKSRIEDVQCMAIETRVFLLDGNTHQDQGRTRRIADELSLVVDEIETLLAELQIASTEAEPFSLQ